ncbi:unnamed protein product, partial [marine sediment metagenome]
SEKKKHLLLLRQNAHRELRNVYIVTSTYALERGNGSSLSGILLHVPIPKWS